MKYLILCALMFTACASTNEKETCVDRPHIECYGLGKPVCGKVAGGCYQCACEGNMSTPFAPPGR